MSAREELLAMMDSHERYFAAEKKARQIAKPLVAQVKDAIHTARLQGFHPDIVCLGVRQMQVLWDAEDASEGPISTGKYHIRGLPIQVIDVADYVGVFERRKFAWC